MITNAKITGKNVKIADYIKQSVSKGDPAYALSRSDLCAILTNPYKWLGEQPEEENDAMVFGTLIDVMLLGRGNTDSIAVCPVNYADDKGVIKPWNWNANVCKEWKVNHSGMTIVKNETHQKAQLAVARLQADQDIQNLLAASDFQVMIEATWTCPETKLAVPLRGLIDIAPRCDKLADLKTTYNAEPRDWARMVFQQGYHVQSALYLDLWSAATGEPRNEFLHIIQETSAPYVVAKRWLSQDFIAMGKAQYEKALLRYCQCLKSGIWESYEESTTIRGWSVCQPEAWMVTRAGVEIPPIDTARGIM